MAGDESYQLHIEALQLLINAQTPDHAEVGAMDQSVPDSVPKSLLVPRGRSPYLL
jgi:hypothetical protein